MKKILFSFTMPHGSYVGGVATVINRYLDAKADFIKKGYSVDLFDYENAVINRIKPSKVANVVYGFAQRNRLVKKLKSDHEDTIVHIHTSCRYLFVKDVLLAKSLKKKYNVPILISVHVGDISTVFNGIPAKFKELSIGILNSCVDKTLFLSPNMRKQFIAAGLKEERSGLLLNFHDFPMKMEDHEHDELRLLFVGAINKEKGIMELLKAVHELPDVNLQLDICGTLTDNSIADDFSGYINELGNRVVLHGYVKGNEKYELFQNADVLVLPSYHEGFPLVILEAMAAGNAIISTPVGTTPEIFGNENILWANVADVESLKAAIIKLKDNPELLRKMKWQNFCEAKKYTKQQHIKKLCDIYDSFSEKK